MRDLGTTKFVRVPTENKKDSLDVVEGGGEPEGKTDTAQDVREQPAPPKTKEKVKPAKKKTKASTKSKATTKKNPEVALPEL